MYERLLCEAENENIEVVSYPLQETIKGLYCNGVIAINKNISTTVEKTCILAEELGHYYTSYGNIIDCSNINNRKQEVKAQRWAAKRLVTFKSIIEAFDNGCRNMFEMAEYIGVTEKFLRDAFSTFNAMYGKYKTHGNYSPLSKSHNRDGLRAHCG